MKSKLAAILLSALLLIAIAGNLYEVFLHGVRFVGSIPDSGPIEPSIISVALLAIICGSDLPAMVRASKIVRAQLQCWVSWLFLVIATPFLERYISAFQAEIVFFLFAALLAIASTLLLIRPNDLFSL